MSALGPTTPRSISRELAGRTAHASRWLRGRGQWSGVSPAERRPSDRQLRVIFGKDDGPPLAERGAESA